MVKPMKYPNSDLGMWHKFAEMAEHLKFVAEQQEISLYSKCKFFGYDDEAFEHHCNQDELEAKRQKKQRDFSPKEECWKCKFYECWKYKYEEKKDGKTT